MEFDTSFKLSLKEAKRFFVGLTFLAPVQDLRFELKILSINDVIKGFSLKEVLKFLGAKPPKSFVRLHEQLVGPIPEPLPLPEPQMKISFPIPESKEEEEKINCAKGAIEKVLPYQPQRSQILQENASSRRVHQAQGRKRLQIYCQSKKHKLLWSL